MVTFGLGRLLRGFRLDLVRADAGNRRLKVFRLLPISRNQQSQSLKQVNTTEWSFIT